MGVGAGLRRLAVLAACASALVLTVPSSHAASLELEASAARALAAGPASLAVGAAPEAQKIRRFRKGRWIPVPQGPSLVLARVVVTLKKPASSATRTADGRPALFVPGSP
jgi:hypothetical protein